MIIGIDLGTTHSLVSIIHESKPIILTTSEGARLLPSVLHVKGSVVSLGYLAKKNRVLDSKNTVFSIKRLLGKTFQEAKAMQARMPYQLIEHQDGVSIQIGDLIFTPIQIASMILKSLKEAAEKALGCTITQAVITVPAYYNDSQRQATRTAGRHAGLNVVRMINEPTAAALAYGYGPQAKNSTPKTIAVYDFGGGTFDLSILRLDSGVFEVLSTHGNTSLGGDDLDYALFDQLRLEIKGQYSVDITTDIKLKAELLEACENLKIAVSSQERAQLKLVLNSGQLFERSFSRQEIHEIFRPIIEKTRPACEQALKDAGIDWTDLDDVVMVGGPTRLKIVQEIASDIFKRQVNISLHPDEVVAQGAAIQADILAGNNPDILLLDIVPLSLGIETYGGVMSTLIQRNSKIPIEAKEVFTTYVDNQTGVDIHILQGERQRVEGNRTLARFKLKGIQPQPASLPRIEVSFLIDADGVLQVAAKDLKTGLEQAIEVKPSLGINDDQIYTALRQGETLKNEDQAFRKLVESKLDAEPVLRATEKNLELAKKHLKADEIQKIETAIFGLKSALNGSDPDTILLKSVLLDQATRHLADLVVKESLSSLKN